MPVDSGEVVRRRFGSRLIALVTLLLLPLLVFDVPQWLFIASQVVWGGGVWVGLSVAALLQIVGGDKLIIPFC
ncbi:hypothetical protein [Klebsiella pneumoniae]|uniref:hypothetical protein n=1 Tax=Klebsiella pneumoniae TaxID=573 RepID=UPI003A4C5AB6